MFERQCWLRCTKALTDTRWFEHGRMQGPVAEKSFLPLFSHFVWICKYPVHRSPGGEMSDLLPGATRPFVENTI